MDQPAGPPIRITGGPAGPVPADPPPGRSAVVPLLLAGLAVVGVVVLTAEEPPAPPSGPDAVLTVAAERLAVTQGGVLVVPLELRNRGPALEVVAADAYAEPVVEDPLVQAPSALAAGRGRRFVALLEPDCRLLRAARGTLSFDAAVLLRVRAGGRTRPLVADLDADPLVAARVAALCG